MIYIMGQVNGNAKAYFSMKNRIIFSGNDKLYILGNVILGNSKRPKQCLKILDDIMKSPNIELLLGKNEFAYLNFEASGKSEYWNSMIENETGGPEFLDLMNGLTTEERNKYIDFLRSCEETAIEKIGYRVFYMVHGAPANYEILGEGRWQEEVVCAELKLDEDYLKKMKSDPTILFDWEEDNQYYFVNSGDLACKVALDSEEIKEKYLNTAFDNYQRILLYNEKIFLHTGCQGDDYYAKYNPTLSCIGIDEDGFTFYHKTHIFN